MKHHNCSLDPEKCLGPNWEAVLRWWLYYESLTEEQKDELDRRWLDIDDVADECAWEIARDAAIEVIGQNNMNVAYRVAPPPEAITMEIIANLDDPFFIPRLVPEFNHKQN